jgi:hypothetical protein
MARKQRPTLKWVRPIPGLEKPPRPADEVLRWVSPDSQIPLLKWLPGRRAEVRVVTRGAA